MSSSMTWQDYVDTQLIATGSARDALIAGLDGGIWARSQGLAEAKPEELHVLLAALESGGASLENTGGVRLAGTRYLYLSSSAGELSCRRGRVGLYARRTERLAIVALYQEPTTLQQCSGRVSTLCRHLANSGF